MRNPMQTLSANEVGKIALKLAGKLEEAAKKDEPFTFGGSDLKDLADILRAIAEQSAPSAWSKLGGAPH
jgi:hypothetical protein